MGALNPLFLAAAGLVALPVFLHLFQRHQARRIAFPALRYLQRTEREHARSIRLRQLLLLLARASLVLLLVGAGARLFVKGRGAAHPPTAIAIVLDNSASSGLVVGDERVLDRLRALARATLDRATDDDRIWVVRAAEPWVPARAAGPGEARRILGETSVRAGRADLTAALARASELVGTSGLPHREIHLLSDLQASAFDPDVVHPAGDVPAVVWMPPVETYPNRGVTGVTVGGGLPPLEGQASEVTLTLGGTPGVDSARVRARVVVDGRIRGAAEIPFGASLSLPIPPAGAGWLAGYVDADPDDLSSDDRRYFAFRSRPPPTLAIAGRPGIFVTEAVEVLAEAGRLRPSTPARADVLISHEGVGLEGGDRTRTVLVIPPTDPTRLPGLNRRLADAGIPWRAEREGASPAADLSGTGLPEALLGVRTSDGYRLAAVGGATGAAVLAEAGGRPWLVEGATRDGERYLLLASPLDPDWSSLPLSTGMVGFVAWAVERGAAAGSSVAASVAGDRIPAPRAADRVRPPSGDPVPIDGTRMVRADGDPGVYAFLAGDSVVSLRAVNVPAEESDLTPLGRRALEQLTSSELTVVRRREGWGRAVFRARQGPELAPWLLLAALLLLVTEGVLASTGRWRRARPAAAVGATHAGS